MPEKPTRAAASRQLPLHHVRSLALAGAVVGVVMLPIAAAQATPQSHDTGVSAPSGSGPTSSQTPTPSPSDATDGGARALAPEFCGTARTAPALGGGSLRVQACVNQTGGTASARVYVANGATIAQIVALNLTRTDGSVVQVQCTIPAGVAGLCETSPVAVSGGSGAFNAIAELVGQNEPVSAGVVHVESGLVAPASA
jgi:hypothetical protein